MVKLEGEIELEDIKKLVSEDKHNNKNIVFSIIPFSLILNIILMIVIIFVAPILANDLLKDSVESIKKLVDSNIVIGNPIIINNIQVIPISKVKYGFITGGSNQVNSPFIGANAGTVSMTPVGLIVYNNQDIKLLHLDTSTHTIEYLIDNIVDIIQEVINRFKNKE